MSNRSGGSSREFSSPPLDAPLDPSSHSVHSPTIPLPQTEAAGTRTADKAIGPKLGDRVMYRNSAPRAAAAAKLAKEAKGKPGDGGHQPGEPAVDEIPARPAVIWPAVVTGVRPVEVTGAEPVLDLEVTRTTNTIEALAVPFSQDETVAPAWFYAK